ncbi:DUF6328 family protein [Streptomyces sp. NPDC058305]|uniref:DUF6328 family protein n=1 Tax=Streptomyces sp. NPDC058305 TaxID=3346438 RepID=UPI0036E8F310
MATQWDDGRRGQHGRVETEEQRADRMWVDLLQELRVAQTGMQVLFGALLLAVFQPTFSRLGETDRALYISTVIVGACSVGLLISPVSLHRVVAGRRIKPQAVNVASWMARLGLVLLAATTVLVLLLLMRLAINDAVAAWLAFGVGSWLVLLWLIFPLWAVRHYADRR